MNSEVTCKGSIQLGTACRQCSKCMEEMRSLRQEACGDKTADLDLERRALKACGYRVHEKERNGTRWLMAVKGLDVQYKHWHPLTSIHQAMQLLKDADLHVTMNYYGATCFGEFECVVNIVESEPTAQDLINAQCRAIVTACASLEPVR